MNKPELLAPAGNFEKLRYALAYGADAVYAGVPRYSLRVRENDFTRERLQEAIDKVHALGKKIYLTMNIYPHNRKIDSFAEMLKTVADMQPDGLIMADPGMIAVAREKHPQLNIHLSTQANAINWQTVKFWKTLGLTRIILSRELGLDEIAEIKQHVPDIELEVFVHGAICIAYSGRCLLSNYFTHRDANQGACTNACRWEYKLYEGSENSQSGAKKPLEYFIEESERPGQLMPIDEDEHGTYIMNARDLSTIDILEKILAAGVDSLKIEGRTKSLYYLSTVTHAYRKAIDSWSIGQSPTESLLDEVNAVANRGYVSGFFERNPAEKGQNYEESHSGHQTRQFIGIIKRWNRKTELATISVRNRFQLGDRVEWFSPKRIRSDEIKQIFDPDGAPLEVAHGGGMDVQVNCEHDPGEYALLRKIRNNVPSAGY